MENQTREQLIKMIKLRLGIDDPDWPSPDYFTRADLIKLNIWMRIKDEQGKR